LNIVLSLYISLGESNIYKLTFGRKNTKKNHDEQQTTPVTNPEIFLRPRGYPKQVVASSSKVYQPKVVQTNDKVPLEQSTSQEGYTQSHFGDTSTNKPKTEVINPEPLLPEIKSETVSTCPSTNKGKGPLLISTFISWIPEVKVSIPRNSEEYIAYPDSTHVGSPVYISCKFEEPNPRLPFSPFSEFLSPTNISPELYSPHYKVAKGPLQVYENPFFISQSSSPHIQMVAVGGASAGGGARGGGGQGPPPPPPRIFAKVVARYAPLSLPPVLHDLLENYIMNLPKFTGEGYLTATEYINFFDQFVDILGIEHGDVYSRLLVQTFESQVRLWF
jgi:hypothetical protein